MDTANRLKKQNDYIYFISSNGKQEVKVLNLTTLLGKTEADKLYQLEEETQGAGAEKFLSYLPLRTSYSYGIKEHSNDIT